MRIHPTPERLRPPAINYPTHHSGPNIEEAFTLYATKHAKEIDTPWIYLPIHWQNLYFVNERRSGTGDYYHDPEAQDLVNKLNPKETYFTLSQADEGTYERLPKNVKVFSAGGAGDYAIPLLTSPLEYTPRKRDILASFMGAKECGGPIDWPGGRAEHSSWNPDGCGALVRRKMFQALEGKHGFHIVDRKFTTNRSYIEGYREILCRSIFALCPRGYGKTSFRLYEAMQLGAIPVYIFDHPWMPFADIIQWPEFCYPIEIGCIWKLEHVLRSLSKVDSLKNIQRRVKEVHDAYFNLDVAPKRIAELVERVSR